MSASGNSESGVRPERHLVAPGHDPAGAPLLAVRNIDVGYGDTQVLWDVSLDVWRGEVVAIVGANGAGKSTLLATISGLLRPWKGEVLLAGRHIERVPAERDRKSTRLNSSHQIISYAVFCLKKKNE